MLDHVLIALDALLEDAPSKAPPEGLLLFLPRCTPHGFSSTATWVRDPQDGWDDTPLEMARTWVEILVEDEIEDYEEMELLVDTDTVTNPEWQLETVEGSRTVTNLGPQHTRATGMQAVYPAVARTVTEFEPPPGPSGLGAIAGVAS
jgi:hypothetical protein